MGGLAGLFGGIASSAGSFGLNYASALLSADIQRDLRRTAYQDQMHSMKKAGLNPILAAGATPGAGQGSISMAAPEDPVTSANQLASGSSQRGLQKAQSTSAKAAAREAEAKADTAEALRDAQKLELEQRAAGHAAGRGLAEARTETEDQLRDPRTRETLNQAGLARERELTERRLRDARDQAYRASAGRDSASANEINRRQPENVFGESGGTAYRGGRHLTELGGDVLDLVPGLRSLAPVVRDILKGRRKAPPSGWDRPSGNSAKSTSQRAEERRRIGEANDEWWDGSGPFSRR